jgi:hypothetical protein
LKESEPLIMKVNLWGWFAYLEKEETDFRNFGIRTYSSAIRVSIVLLIFDQDSNKQQINLNFYHSKVAKFQEDILRYT